MEVIVNIRLFLNIILGFTLLIGTGQIRDAIATQPTIMKTISTRSPLVYPESFVSHEDVKGRETHFPYLVKYGILHGDQNRGKHTLHTPIAHRHHHHHHRSLINNKGTHPLAARHHHHHRSHVNDKGIHPPAATHHHRHHHHWKHHKIHH